MLEQRGISAVPATRADDTDIGVLVDQLGIVSAHQGGTDKPGSIYVTIQLPPERSGGMVPETGDALAHWLTGWLREPQQADNLGKLNRSGASERHLFVLFPGFTPAPFPAIDLLMRAGAPIPTVPPTLPVEMTHLWAMSTWRSGDGFRWSPGTGWARFTKVFDNVE